MPAPPITPRAQMLRLLEHGYFPVPVSRSEGVPLVKFGEATPYPSTDDVRRWDAQFSKEYAIAVASRDALILVDFDINDAQLAGALREQLAEWFEDAPIRINRATLPRFCLMVRGDTSLLSRGNCVLRIGADQAIEVKSFNQTVTILGPHRKHQVPYSWAEAGAGVTPLHIPCHQLPVMNTHQMDRLIEVATMTAQAIDTSWHTKQGPWSKRREMTTGEATPFDPLSAAKPPVPGLTKAGLERILNGVDGTTREDWLRMGMALHHQFGGREEGLELWEEWSRRFSGDWGEDTGCAASWEEFSVSGRSMGEHAVTMASYLHLSRPKVQPPTPTNLETPVTDVDDMLENFIYIEKGQQVGMMTDAQGEDVMTLGELKSTWSNRVVPVGKKEVNPIVLWHSHPERKTCYDLNYRPSTERVIAGPTHLRRKAYYNTYVHPQHPETHDESLLPYFTDHVEYLFGREGSKWMFNFLAHLVQRPEDRPTVAPVHISLNRYGTGRGLLNSLVEGLVGKDNATTSEIGVVMNSQFNEYLHQSTWCSVGETSISGKQRFQVNERIKIIIGDSRLRINIAHGFKGPADVYTRIFFASNHLDCFVVDEEDRRLQFFLFEGKIKPLDYYAILADQIQNPAFIQQVYWWLMRQPINEDWVRRSTMNEAKRLVIDASHSDTARLYITFINYLPHPFFTEAMFRAYKAKNLAQVNEHEMVHLNKQYVRERRQVTDLKTRHEDGGAPLMFCLQPTPITQDAYAANWAAIDTFGEKR